MASTKKLRDDEIDMMLIETDWDWQDCADHIGCNEIDRIVEQISDCHDATLDGCDEYL